MLTKSLWWEGNDLYIEFEDGKILCFKDATVTDHKIEFNSDAAIIEETPIKFESLFGGKK